ncbi:HDOD domain-containing protein [Methylomonas sp. HYX-M1]|uniref:HDOD domain-containing protein n=1 Tax=Methylomonas sp. HYX-M1 TaxID=3139307 RepID=UPI00345B6FC3
MKRHDSLSTLPQSLEEWVYTLQVEKMPIFSHTAGQIYSALDDNNKGAMELASIILQDPNLTAKLLKISNSPYYNPSRQKIGTVSRAIVIMGMQLIRELTLACSFFESILSSANKECANREIAKAIHSAVQARELAVSMGDKSPEEVFVAALLMNVGKVAFWCSNSPAAAKIQELLKVGVNSLDAEKRVLGFTLEELGGKLNQSWRLGGLIEAAMTNKDTNDIRVKLVRLSEKLCGALEIGEESKELMDCVQELAGLSDLSKEQVKAKVSLSTLKAVEIAQQFGAHDASKYISKESIAVTEIEPKISEAQFDYKNLQLQILQEIALHVSGAIDINILLEMVLEGVHRGVNMDRTLFMILNKNRTSVIEKISLGWSKLSGSNKIQFTNEESGRNILFHGLESKNGFWAKPQEHPSLYTAQIVKHMGKHECFVFPVQIEMKPIGLIYCDRGVHHRPLTIEDFSIVNHFVKQVQIGLTLYRIRH